LKYIKNYLGSKLNIAVPRLVNFSASPTAPGNDNDVFLFFEVLTDLPGLTASFTAFIVAFVISVYGFA